MPTYDRRPLYRRLQLAASALAACAMLFQSGCAQFVGRSYLEGIFFTLGAETVLLPQALLFGQGLLDALLFGA